MAVFAGDRVDVIRNNRNSKVTPSVVRHLPSGAVQVGQPAYQYFGMPDAAASTLVRFKRSTGIQGSQGGCRARKLSGDELE